MVGESIVLKKGMEVFGKHGHYRISTEIDSGG